MMNNGFDGDLSYREHRMVMINLRGDGLSKALNEINEAMTQGFKPHGTPFEMEGVYFQALVRE